MDATLAYKPNLSEVIERLRALFSGQAPDQVFAVFNVPTRALEEFGRRYPEGYCAAPQLVDRLAFWDQHLAERRGLEDDSVPAAYLSEFDQGLYGALIGGQVQYMAHPDNGWISSMVSPVLKSWDDLPQLAFHPDHPAFQNYLKWLDAFAEAARGKFAISHFILINGLNFVFELVGASNTYLALYEHSEEVRQAIELAFVVNRAIHRSFFERTELIAGGTASNMVQWMPGRIISESVDPFHMTSVDCFEKWGREPVERIFSEFDGGVLHLHANGRHLLAAIATINGLRAIYLGDDRGYPPAVDVLETLRPQAAGLPLVVHVPWARFVEKLRAHELPGGVLYHVSGAPDVDEANRLMEQVRAYRA